MDKIGCILYVSGGYGRVIHRIHMPYDYDDPLKEDQGTKKQQGLSTMCTNAVARGE